MRFCSLVFPLFCAFTAMAHAETEPLPLTPSRNASDIAPAQPGKDGLETPVSITADRLQGSKDKEIEAIGDVEVHHDDQAIFADHVTFQQDSKDLAADGNVRVEQNGNVMTGPNLELNLDTRVGNITQPEFFIGTNNARGSADLVDIQGANNYTLHNVDYTTCPIGNDDWLLRTRELEIDRSRQIGVAHHARVEFKGVPILYTPWMDFPLNNQRKSGLLGPTFGSTGKGGSEVTVPFFWNIAPNRDATLAPRVMAKRGVLFNNEFRYLEKNYSGEAHYDVLPNDRLSQSTRSRSSLRHLHKFGSGLNGWADLNYVSDDAYFRDLSGAVSSTSQTHLVREGMLTYDKDWWNAAVRVQRFQTLQDPEAPVAIPYRRVPQITVGAQRAQGDVNLAFSGELVSFRHPTAVNGQRYVAYPSLSYFLISNPAFYLTPKFGVHSTRYNLGDNYGGTEPNRTRNVPIFSLDSGVALEREWSNSEQTFVQTLEPRAYYVYIPYREQNTLPNFDTAQADFSFAQMFTENRFFGNDRIGDANHITLALTSRLLDQNNGAEQLRVTIGERFSLKTPQVNLNTPTSTTNKSDILLAASGRLTRSWSLDSAMQYNPNLGHGERFNLAARYHPEAGKVLNLGYRFTRNSLRQVDISTQWPLTGRWDAVARWNYSLQDNRILEAMTGLEYNHNCWAVRLVAQRFATATNEVSTGFFVQLELTDLVRVGVGDPLNVLQQSVPGYAKQNPSTRNNPDAP